jgi:hypothetical protein
MIDFKRMLLDNTVSISRKTNAQLVEEILRKTRKPQQQRQQQTNINGMLHRANSWYSPVQNKSKGKNALFFAYPIILGLMLLVVCLLYGDINGSHYKYHLAYAHSFEPNDMSTFLALTNRAQVELLLAIADFPTNASLSSEHTKNAAKLIDIVYRMDDDIVDDDDFMKRYTEVSNSQNSSIHALGIANIVDQVLIEYGKANDIRFDLTNMSNIVNHSSQFRNNLTGPVGHYQTALKLSERAYEVFKNLSPQPTSLTRDDSYVLTKLEDRLIDLTNMVRSNVSAQDIMVVAHHEIHPYLQAAYDLKLRG